jgi:DUF1009 family protein
MSRARRRLPPDGGAVASITRANHDMRFDIPCLGPQTVETCAAARIAVLALEADKSLLLEQETCAGFAKRHNITIVTVG